MTWTFRLSEEDFGKIQQVLASLLEKTGVDAIFLINRNGHEMARCGKLENIDVMALSSLAASNLAATFGLAQIIGEDEFARIYMRGKSASILICPSGEYGLLLFVIQTWQEHQVSLRDLKQATLVLEDVLNRSVSQLGAGARI